MTTKGWSLPQNHWTSRGPWLVQRVFFRRLLFLLHYKHFRFTVSVVLYQEKNSDLFLNVYFFGSLYWCPVARLFFFVLFLNSVVLQLLPNTGSVFKIFFLRIQETPSIPPFNLSLFTNASVPESQQSSVSIWLRMCSVRLRYLRS